MASELLSDVTFFNGIVNSSAIKSTEKNEILNASKNKTSRKSVNPNSSRRKTQEITSVEKENLVPEKTGTKKPGRPSKKLEREPLKVVNTTVKTPKKSASSATKKNGVSLVTKKNKVSSENKKNGVSPATKKNKVSSENRKSTSKVNSTSSRTSRVKKDKESIPKIIVYKDDPNNAKVQAKRITRSCAAGLSKSQSWNGLDKTGRRSQEMKKSPKLSDSEAKRVRYSLNDLSRVKTSNKNYNCKNLAETKKSPAKPNSRLSKFKFEGPESEEMFLKLETLFPNVDPEFMKSHFARFKGSLSETIEFLIIKEKSNDLPTRDDYIRRSEVEKLNNKFIEQFSIENFLKMIPNPWEHFLKTERKNCVNYFGHSLHYLKNKYKKHYLQAIQESLKKNGGSLYLANKELKRKNRWLKMRATNRSKYECDAGKPTTFDIQFIHEVAFIENEAKIKSHIKKAEIMKVKKFKEAERAGTLLECQSCNDYNLLVDDAVNCPANHIFCKDCVIKYVEIEMGRDNFQFKCLVKCDKKFSVESLQTILSSSVMARIIKRNQLEEIKSAKIDDLVCCPFCYYVVIMPPEMTVLKCLNPGCLMESCRHCKQLNHIPLKCHELEKFDKSILEIAVEIEKQEEQEIKKELKDLSVTCNHCKGEFFKKDDSNIMVCPCGATMCSICRQPFPECQHSTQICEVPSQHLSFSSDDTVIEHCKYTAEDDFERSSDCSENFMGFLPSESDSF